MSVTDTPTFTPGLTHGQRQQVADALARVGTVPIGKLAVTFMDCDVQAAHVFSTRYQVRAALRGELDTVPRADAVAEAVAVEHGITITAAAFAYGLALALRLGRRFWPHTTMRRYISDDWRRLDRNQQERAARFVRALLRGEEPRHVPGPRPGSRQTKTTIAADLAAVKRWKAEAGQRVRAEARR